MLTPLTLSTSPLFQLTARRPRPSFRAPASWTQSLSRSPWNHGICWGSTAAQVCLHLKAGRWDLPPKMAAVQGRKRWSCDGDPGKGLVSSLPLRRRQVEVSGIYIVCQKAIEHNHLKGLMSMSESVRVWAVFQTFLCHKIHFRIRQYTVYMCAIHCV